ncbi:O-antigen ligase family protein [Desulfatiferula olefinivorans]
MNEQLRKNISISNLQFILISICILALPLSRFFRIHILSSEITVSDFFLLINMGVFFLLMIYRLKMPVSFVVLSILPIIFFVSYLFNIKLANPITTLSVVAKIALVSSVVLTWQYQKKYQIIILISGCMLSFLGIFFTEGIAFDLDIGLLNYNRNELSHYLVLPIIISFLCFTRSRHNYLDFRRLCYLMLFLFQVVILILTSSRGTIFSMALTFILFSILKLNIKYLVLIVIVILSIFFLKTHYFGEYATKRYQIITGGKLTGSDKHRLEYMITGFEYFKSSPVYGTGPGTFLKLNPKQRVMHNTVMSTLAQTGLLGIFAFMIIYLYPLIIGIREMRRNYCQTAIPFFIFAMTVIFMNSLTIEALPKYPLYLSIAMVLSSAKELKIKRLQRNYGEPCKAPI